MSRTPDDIDRLEVRFDEESLVADAGLLVAGTLIKPLGLERLLDDTVRMGGRVGGSRPGRKILSLVVSMLLGGSHIDHADRLRSGPTRRVLSPTREPRTSYSALVAGPRPVALTLFTPAPSQTPP